MRVTNTGVPSVFKTKDSHQNICDCPCIVVSGRVADVEAVGEDWAIVDGAGVVAVVVAGDGCC